MKCHVKNYNHALIKNIIISTKSVGVKIVKSGKAERHNSACSELIFIIQAQLELHMIDKSGEGWNEINLWCFKICFKISRCLRKFRSLRKPSYRHPEREVRGRLFSFQGDLNSRGHREFVT